MFKENYLFLIYGEEACIWSEGMYVWGTLIPIAHDLIIQYWPFDKEVEIQRL